jgi:ABC-2 type transport system ATP-binding protein
MSAIEIRNVKKRYKDLQALKGVSLTVEEGEFFGLLGPNGRRLSAYLPVSRAPTKAASRYVATTW